MTYRRFIDRLSPVQLLLAAALTLAVLIGHAAAATTGPLSGPLVEADWLKANLGREDVVVLDTRSANGENDPYLEGHIPGALSAPYPGGWRTERDGIPGQLPPLPALEAHIGGLGISGEETIVIVPAAASSSEFGGATRIYWTLKLLGIDDVAILNGGYRAWTADASAPLENEAAEATPVAFKAQLRPQLLVSSDEVRQRLGESSTVMLDGRPLSQFAGKEKHPAAQRYGRLPGAVNLDQSVFFDAETGRVVAKDAAMSLVPPEAAKADAEIVSYCNTGHWASMNWFVLSEVLGYENVRLFDDSMVGWTENPDNPVDSDRSRWDDIKSWWNGQS
ncbi:sulfurtransferase [Afifella pfennigii]|uniref:sulfurtransferase n=1 Tax=Afifella pfennigii TaxID=209897 RepID=UPI000A69B1D4|nr:rhodanese-like domain-containing protein [Afifella pfennigii]